MTAASTAKGPRLGAYSVGSPSVPEKHWLWPLYGAGFENLGVDEKPLLVKTPVCGPEELLVRHDAVGLCFSDTKVIKTGEGHPRLGGRDMTARPVVLGHEVAMTVIEVGEAYADRFEPGQRYLLQADIYYHGVGLAYGYALQGGLSQYNVIGKEVLEGDEGCYLIPIQPETGYAQAALTEPWACVLASYDVVYRCGWKSGGSVLVAGGPGAMAHYELGMPYAHGQPPARVVTMGVGGTLLAELRRRATDDGVELIEVNGTPDAGAPPDAALKALRTASGQDGFDDIVLLGADAALYERLEALANRGCIINIVGEQALARAVQVDVGRLHYDSICLVGTAEALIDAAYEPIRSELLPGGSAAFLGAGGPMGQMHVQRALQLDDGPRLVVATDLVPERLTVLEEKLGQIISGKHQSLQVVMRSPGEESPASFDDGLLSTTGGVGFDDIVVLAPSARVVSQAVGMLAPKGVMNIFAGLPRGTMASIALGTLVSRGVRFTGTSGSSIRDLRVMLGEAESGRLDPNLSVVAISGLLDAKRGLEGVVNQSFPGKIVVYPQVLSFPLTRLHDLLEVLPCVYEKLGPNESWTVEAEAEFLIKAL